MIYNHEIHPSKIYNSTISSTSRELSNCYHHPIPEHFHHPVKKFCTYLQIITSHSPFPKFQATKTLIFVSMDLPILGISHK